MHYTIKDEALESLFPKMETFLTSIEPLSRNRDLNMTQNWHVYASYCRPEVDCDVISGRNVKTIMGYIVVKFQVASSSGFGDIKKVISWRQRTSMIALSENAFTFRAALVILQDIYFVELVSLL